MPSQPDDVAPNPQRDWLSAIDSLQPRVWSGTAYRHVALGRDPLSGAGARMLGGRWNPPDLFGAIYLAFPQETAVQEFRRMAAGQARGTTSFLPRSLVTVNVPPTRVLDMTSPEAALATGLGLGEMAADDRGPCQEVAQAAHFLHFQGLHPPLQVPASSWWCSRTECRSAISWSPQSRNSLHSSAPRSADALLPLVARDRPWQPARG